MQQEPTQVKCPKFDFHFRGKCCNSTCVLWHKSEEAAKVNCLQLDFAVSDGLSYTQAKNSKLLMQLSMSEDPKVQLATSQSLMHMALVLAMHVCEFEALDYALCSCGARKSACPANGACRTRRDWFDWLSKLFHPIISLNATLTKAELYHIFIVTLIQFNKNDQLPPFIEQALPNLALSKRIV